MGGNEIAVAGVLDKGEGRWQICIALGFSGVSDKSRSLHTKAQVLETIPKANTPNFSPPHNFSLVQPKVWPAIQSKENPFAMPQDASPKRIVENSP